jgi:hypothetical protein
MDKFIIDKSKYKIESKNKKLLNLETYCSKCKRNTTMINTSFQRLANYKAVINENCSI